MRRRLGPLLAAALLLLAFAGDAGAQGNGGISRGEATQTLLRYPKVAHWVTRYPKDEVVTTASFDERAKLWKVGVFSGRAGEIAAGSVTTTGTVAEAWAGPQVAWPLARGTGLGGAINNPWLWLLLSGSFFLGLANLRRPLSMQNLDLLALLSFSAYLYYFNDGRVFASVVAASASLVYLVARCAWIGLRNRGARWVCAAPVWLLVAAILFLGGLRVGLNVLRSSTLDISYAGVIGADRLEHGVVPYGNFPVKGTTPCGPADANGDIANWIQDNGRCEAANPLGDTYGPVDYHAYLPGLWLLGWSGKWDSLPAVHFTTLLFDLLACLGLAAAGYRYGRTRLAVTLAFAWVAYPFTQYVSSSNANDSIMAAFLVWGFWAASSHTGRGVFAALGAWTKLGSLIVVPLWATYPERRLRGTLVFAGAFALATILSFWVILASGHPLHELHVFYERTFQIQAERSSPFSPWDWGDYHAAGLPDLKLLQRVLQVALVAAALGLAVYPRRKSLLQLAAFTAVLLLGFELSLTHWTATYIVWFFPFVLLASAGDLLRAPQPTVAPEASRPRGTFHRSVKEPVSPIVD